MALGLTIRQKYGKIFGCDVKKEEEETAGGGRRGEMCMEREAIRRDRVAERQKKERYEGGWRRDTHRHS